jgi:hypothetical protein
MFLNELSDADIRRRHEACALLFERFPTALSCGKVFYQTNVQFTAAAHHEMLMGQTESSLHD